VSALRRDHSIFEAELAGRTFDMRLVGRLVGYLRPYRGRVAATALCVVASSLLAVLLPVVTARVLIDGVLRRQAAIEAPDFGMQELAAALASLTGLAPLPAACALYGALMLAWAGLVHAQRLLLAGAAFRALRDLRGELFAHLERLAPSFWDHVAVGRVMTRVTNDVEVLYELLWGLGMLSGEIVPFALAVALMAIADPPLAALLLVAAPLVGLATWAFGRVTRRVYRAVRSSVSRLNQNLQENLAGVLVVQVHGREATNLDRYRAINRENRESEYRAIGLETAYGAFVESLAPAALAAIVWFGGGQALAGAITLGTLILFAQYADMLFYPIVAVGEQYNVLYRAMASAERIFQLLDWRERVAEPERPLALPPRLRGRVEFKNVSFDYGGGPVLRNVSFAIEPGERVAIVGATGSGKTTLVRLLSRLYDFREGGLEIDGIDVRRVPVADLRRRIGIVLQDFHVFAGTVRENLRLGNPAAEDRRVEEVAALVAADRFIRALPRGYDTPLAERGENLSHGQRQLLAFARVLVADPEILVLDEATASVDPETERLIQQALRTITAGRTSILIAHRLLTVREADRIVVLSRGRVREVGSHAELVARSGHYRTLYELQFREEGPLEASAG
jgi:ATP-binding cassette subfamily B protein